MMSENIAPSNFEYNSVFAVHKSFLFDLCSPHVVGAVNSLARESPEDLQD